MNLKTKKNAIVNKQNKMPPRIVAPVQAMQLDANILPVDINMNEIYDRFAVRAIQVVSPRSPVNSTFNLLTSSG